MTVISKRVFFAILRLTFNESVGEKPPLSLTIFFSSLLLRLLSYSRLCASKWKTEEVLEMGRFAQRERERGKKRIRKIVSLFLEANWTNAINLAIAIVLEWTSNSFTGFYKKKKKKKRKSVRQKKMKETQRERKRKIEWKCWPDKWQRIQQEKKNLRRRGKRTRRHAEAWKTMQNESKQKENEKKHSISFSCSCSCSRRAHFLCVFRNVSNELAMWSTAVCAQQYAFLFLFHFVLVFFFFALSDRVHTTSTQTIITAL